MGMHRGALARVYIWSCFEGPGHGGCCLRHVFSALGLSPFPAALFCCLRFTLCPPRGLSFSIGSFGGRPLAGCCCLGGLGAAVTDHTRLIRGDGPTDMPSFAGIARSAAYMMATVTAFV